MVEKLCGKAGQLTPYVFVTGMKVERIFLSFYWDIEVKLRNENSVYCTQNHDHSNLSEKLSLVIIVTNYVISHIPNFSKSLLIDGWK